VAPLSLAVTAAELAGAELAASGAAGATPAAGLSCAGVAAATTTTWPAAAARSASAARLEAVLGRPRVRFAGTPSTGGARFAGASAPLAPLSEARRLRDDDGGLAASCLRARGLPPAAVGVRPRLSVSLPLLGWPRRAACGVVGRLPAMAGGVQSCAVHRTSEQTEDRYE